MKSLQPITRRVRRFVVAARDISTILRHNSSDRRYLTTAYDDRVALPPGAQDELRPENPQLLELRARYANLDTPAIRHVQWGNSATSYISDHLRYFRGDSPYVWHYRELPKVTRLKYLIFLKYVVENDQAGLLAKLEEDGQFGCWRFEYPGYPAVSRDLLDSINEINFLDRHLGISSKTNFRILDIGAGYGRLAHRILTAVPGVSDYCCVDAIAESTFLCDYYLRFRGLAPRAWVVPLDEVEESLKPEHFSLAINVHSFSECTLEAVTWWIEQLKRMGVPRLFIVPNDGDKLLTTETDGVKRDFLPVLEAAGYRLETSEPVFSDPAVQDALEIYDQFMLFVKDEGK